MRHNPSSTVDLTHEPAGVEKRKRCETTCNSEASRKRSKPVTTDHENMWSGQNIQASIHSAVATFPRPRMFEDVTIYFIYPEDHSSQGNDCEFWKGCEARGAECVSNWVPQVAYIVSVSPTQRELAELAIWYNASDRHGVRVCKPEWLQACFDVGRIIDPSSGVAEFIWINPTNLIGTDAACPFNPFSNELDKKEADTLEDFLKQSLPSVRLINAPGKRMRIANPNAFTSSFHQRVEQFLEDGQLQLDDLMNLVESERVKQPDVQKYHIKLALKDESNATKSRIIATAQAQDLDFEKVMCLGIRKDDIDRIWCEVAKQVWEGNLGKFAEVMQDRDSKRVAGKWYRINIIYEHSHRLYVDSLMDRIFRRLRAPRSPDRVHKYYCFSLLGIHYNNPYGFTITVPSAGIGLYA